MFNLENTSVILISLVLHYFRELFFFPLALRARKAFDECENLKSFGIFNQVGNQRTVKNIKRSFKSILLTTFI